MDFSTALSTLNTELGDSDNFALTADEKTRALTRAWNDRYVVEEVLDETLVYQDDTNRYTIPTGIKNIVHIYQDLDENEFKGQIPVGAYDIIDGQLQVLHAYRYLLEDNEELYIHGWKKLTTSDSITDADLQEYVLKLAQLNSLNVLLNKRTFKFIKNDTSVAELVAVKRELEEDVREYRRQQRTFFQEV